MGCLLRVPEHRSVAFIQLSVVNSEVEVNERTMTAYSSSNACTGANVESWASRARLIRRFSTICLLHLRSLVSSFSVGTPNTCALSCSSCSRSSYTSSWSSCFFSCAALVRQSFSIDPKAEAKPTRRMVLVALRHFRLRPPALQLPAEASAPSASLASLLVVAGTCGASVGLEGAAWGCESAETIAVGRVPELVSALADADSLCPRWRAIAGSSSSERAILDPTSSSP